MACFMLALVLACLVVDADTRVDSNTECDLCLGSMAVIDGLIRQNKSVEVINDAAIDLCIAGHVQKAEVCRGLISKLTPELIYIITTAYTDARDVCRDLKICSTGAKRIGQRPPPSLADTYATPPGQCGSGGPTGTFVHVTDLHVDVLYQEGTNAACGMPECCRAVNGPGTGVNAAGKFGSYLCDSPPALIEALVTRLAQLDPLPDFILWTGDFSGHDIWENSPAEILSASKWLADQFSAALPNVTVFPAIGNHEAYPINQFQGPGKDDWLYTGLADIWQRWLPDAAVVQIRFGSYYATTVPVSPKLRIISLHTMLGNGGSQGDYWLLLNRTNPAVYNDLGNQLAWLSTTLQSAQTAGEKVYIIGHIPTGDPGMIASYADRIHAMVAQYTDTIAGLFFGHTHFDHFEVVRDVATNSIPINIAYITPSVTPSYDHNPGFRVNYYDKTTFEVLDWDQYTANLTAANAEGTINWNLSYSPRMAYNMTCLRPGDWQTLIGRMSWDSSLFNQVYYHYMTDRPFSCNNDCRVAFICMLASFTNTLTEECEAFAADAGRQLHM